MWWNRQKMSDHHQILVLCNSWGLLHGWVWKQRIQLYFQAADEVVIKLFQKYSQIPSFSFPSAKISVIFFYSMQLFVIPLKVKWFGGKWKSFPELQSHSKSFNCIGLCRAISLEFKAGRHREKPVSTSLLSGIVVRFISEFSEIKLQSRKKNPLAVYYIFSLCVCEDNRSPRVRRQPCVLATTSSPAVMRKGANLSSQNCIVWRSSCNSYMAFKFLLQG